MKLSQLRQEAGKQLQENGNGFSRLILLHTAISAGVSLLLMLITWLSQQWATEGGLGNMGIQTLLTTGQTMLQLINMIAVPFWDAGLIFCSLRLLRRQSNSLYTLAEGFRRWGPIGSSLVIQGLIYFFITMASSLASSFIVSALPLPPSLLDDLTAFVEAPAFPLTDSVKIFLALYMVVYAATLFIFLIPKVYLHRLISYKIMDVEPCSGIQAVMYSRTIMRGHRKKLFLLDLHFWWFYLLELIISIISTGNSILTEFGIPLPINADVALWIFPIAALLMRLVLYYFAKPRLIVSYAVFYQKVSEGSLSEPETPQPKRMPWKY